MEPGKEVAVMAHNNNGDVQKLLGESIEQMKADLTRLEEAMNVLKGRKRRGRPPKVLQS